MSSTDWLAGYRAALGDFEKLIVDRTNEFPTRFRAVVALLLADLRTDADTIDHEELNRRQRAALRTDNAARSAARKQPALL